MKNILLKLFGIFSVVFSIFFITTDFSHAQNSTCNVTGVGIRTTKVINNPNGDADGDGETNWQEEFFNDEQRPFVYFDIQTSGCVDDLDDNYDMEFALAERDFSIDLQVGIPQLDDWDIDVPTANFTIAYLAGENLCDQGGSPDCEYHVEIWDNNSSGEEFGNLKYNCDDGCFENWIYLDFLSYGAVHPNDQNGTSTINDTTENTTCDVIDAKFRNNVVIDNPNGDNNADGVTNFEEEFLGNGAYVYFDIKTTGCLDTNLDYDLILSLMEADNGEPVPPVFLPDFVDDAVLLIPELHEFKIDVPDNNFTIVYLAGENQCEVSGSPMCEYYLTIWDGNSNIPPPFGGDNWGSLNYSCSGLSCLQNWSFLGFLPYEQNHQYDNTPINPVPGTTTPTPGINESYLAPLPGLESASSGLQGFLQGLFNIAIIIAGILAILMIVIGAITYLSTDSLSGTEKGRDMMLNAVFGLILALGAWVILNTLNPNLAESLRITIPRVELDGYSYTEPGVASIPSSGCGPHQPPSCPTCQPIQGGIQLKPEVAQSGHNTISEPMLQKLYNMHSILSQNNISWRVTEAFMPTYMQHCSQCHYNGNCIDANFTSTSPTPQTIEAFVNAAASAGLRAVYETNNPATINALQQQTSLQPSTKKGKGNYLLLNGITAPHFSVYNQ